MQTMKLAEWTKYKTLLAKISKTASDEFVKYFTSRGGYGKFSRSDIIKVAYALVTKYGEASAEAACQMYDATALLEGVSVASAIPAETATMEETAKAVNGCLKQSPTGQLLDDVIYRLVKQAAADTTLQNAVRDGSEWAWIPQGDTCMFCITLASRGWQYASKKMLKNGHAEHIHANCDCQFAVRFGNLNVEGYDPDSYLELYNSYDGDINAMRRAKYQRDKDAINARKRANYARRKSDE